MDQDTMQHIIITGAGASGLMAAYLLSQKGYRITILEARDRIGGRVHTQREGPFSKPVELGAEFIHGDLELTKKLLDEAGISYTKLDGEMWHYKEGRFHKDDAYAEHWPLLMQKLNDLETDCSINDFLQQEFAGERYEDMRRSVIRFAEGYDAADANKVSAFSLRDEWSHSDDNQYRVEGGYGRLMHYLYNQSENNGAAVHLSAVVKSIQWQQGKATVTIDTGSSFEADKVIITVPLSILQEEQILIMPALPEQIKAAKNIGCGQVIKYTLQFREDFWRSSNVAQLKELQMLLSDEEIPTWWTQYPESSALLTGWVSGPRAWKMKDLDQAVLLDKALQSLSRIFQEPPGVIKNNLDAWMITNWPADPFAQCAYSYAMPGSELSRQTLQLPVEDTIHFAGEALSSGPSTGTVEAALQSAQDVVNRITKGISLRQAQRP